MLKIYICEDIKEQRDQFLKDIKDIIALEDLDMKIEISSEDPYEVLEHVKNIKETGLYFLDINLKTNIDGVVLAKEIRKYDPRGFIVFITTHTELTLLTFEHQVEALDYIIKDTINMGNNKEKFHKCILNAYEKYSNSITQNKRLFNLKIGEKVMNIECDKILFFETSQKTSKVKLHLSNGILEFHASMKDVEKQLDENFYRCHNSYIVNVENIDSINTKEQIALMKNGSECLISRRPLKGLLKLYKNYIKI